MFFPGGEQANKSLPMAYAVRLTSHWSLLQNHVLQHEGTPNKFRRAQLILHVGCPSIYFIFLGSPAPQFSLAFVWLSMGAAQHVPTWRTNWRLSFVDSGGEDGGGGDYGGAAASRE